MRKFRVFAKNAVKYVDELSTFDGLTIAVTNHGGIIAYDLKTKTWMQLDPEVYEVCYNTYVVDKNKAEIFENDVLYHGQHHCYYQVVRNNITQGFDLKEVYPFNGDSEDLSQALNTILDSERLGNFSQVMFIEP